MIFKYLDKWFYVCIDLTGFKYFDKFSSKKLTFKELCDIIKKIFGDAELNGLAIDDIVSDWHDEGSSRITSKIDNYLRKCSVKLGARWWVILKPNKKTLRVDDVIDEFKTDYNEDFIRFYYEVWCLNRIEIESKKNMEKQ